MKELLKQYGVRFFSSQFFTGYKVKFVHAPVIDRQLRLKRSNCIMPISVGQNIDAHEGEKFSATLQLVDKSFSEVALLIDDTVQRHTLRILKPGYSDQELMHYAFKEGDVWLERNKKIYEKLTIPYKIIRWDFWRCNENFNAKYQEVLSLYQNNEKFKNSVDKTANQYLNRIGKHVFIERESAFLHCKDYLLEECVAMLQWSPLYDFELYPSGRNPAMISAYEHLVAPEFPEKSVSISLRFKTLTAAKDPIFSDPLIKDEFSSFRL